MCFRKCISTGRPMHAVVAMSRGNNIRTAMHTTRGADALEQLHVALAAMAIR